MLPNYFFFLSFIFEGTHSNIMINIISYHTSNDDTQREVYHFGISFRFFFHIHINIFLFMMFRRQNHIIIVIVTVITFIVCVCVYV